MYPHCYLLLIVVVLFSCCSTAVITAVDMCVAALLLQRPTILSTFCHWSIPTALHAENSCELSLHNILTTIAVCVHVSWYLPMDRERKKNFVSNHLVHVCQLEKLVCWAYTKGRNVMCAATALGCLTHLVVER